MPFFIFLLLLICHTALQREQSLRGQTSVPFADTPAARESTLRGKSTTITCSSSWTPTEAQATIMSSICLGQGAFGPLHLYYNCNCIYHLLTLEIPGIKVLKTCAIFYYYFNFRLSKRENIINQSMGVPQNACIKGFASPLSVKEKS